MGRFAAGRLRTNLTTSASPTAVFQLTIVMASCGWSLGLESGVTGGPTLRRHRINDALSPRSSGPNHVTACGAGASSAVLRATIEVLATQACETPATNKRKRKG